ncbi:hypothetical protein BLOT_009544 [Blomia tropicalis]|nr:hypothetical protein BLOT_009544 [Blomia tropicalis]
MYFVAKWSNQPTNRTNEMSERAHKYCGLEKHRMVNDVIIGTVIRPCVVRSFIKLFFYIRRRTIVSGIFDVNGSY